MNTTANTRVIKSRGLGFGSVLLYGSLCLGAALTGCKKDPPAPNEVPPALQTVPSPPPEVLPPRPNVDAPQTNGAPSVEVQALSALPASFDGAPKAEVKNAIQIGCEARSKDSWLELLCRKKNSTGGKPVRALFTSDADAAASRGETVPANAGLPEQPGAAPTAAAASAAAGTGTTGSAASAAPSGSAAAEGDAGVPTIAVMPSERGELKVLVPWAQGRKTTVRIEWTDVAYDLIVDGPQAELKRPANIQIRKACAALTNTADGLVASAKKSGALQQADVKDLPKFGRCQLAGTGAWALALDAITATGGDASRSVGVKLSAVHLDEEGKKVTAPFTELTFAPGGLDMPTPMIFDYDDDGSHEMIVRYEIKARPQPANGALPTPPGVLSFKDGKIQPFSVGNLAPGGFSVEQLDKDMRPDVADYGPFTAYLSKTCGAAKCPSRIQGPRFFLQSKADGSFDRSSEGAKAALKRACGEKPTTLVVAGAQGVNVQTTAERVACARAWQMDSQQIEQQLLDAKAKLCTAGDTCEVLTTLQAWAGANAPTTL